jgi:hypothetical protein
MSKARKGYLALMAALPAIAMQSCCGCFGT